MGAWAVPLASQAHSALPWGPRPAPPVEQERTILCLEARCNPHASRVVWELSATLAKHRAAIASQATTAPIPPRSRRNVPQDPIALLRAAPLICANQASCALKKGLLSKRRARRGTTVLLVTKVFPAQRAHSPHQPVRVDIFLFHARRPAADLHFAGQISDSTCRPCSPSQICPEGTSNPTSAQATTTTWQIVTYVLSGIGSVIGILVSVFKVYPAIKGRVAKLREAGIRPTIKRIIFLDKTLSKYRPLLDHVSTRDASLEQVSLRGAAAAATSPGFSVTEKSPPALLRLNASHIGALVRF